MSNGSRAEWTKTMLCERGDRHGASSMNRAEQKRNVVIWSWFFLRGLSKNELFENSDNETTLAGAFHFVSSLDVAR
jgi:hypothetical protein